MLLSARIFSKIATIIVMVFIARKLGSEAFGIYSGVIALTIFTGLLSDFGLILPTIRRISYDEKHQSLFIGETIAVRLFWGGIALVIIGILGGMFNFPFLLVLLFSLSSILEILATSLVRVFEGRQEMKVVTLYTVVERCFFCLCVLLALWYDEDIVSVGVAYLISYTVMLSFSIALFQRQVGKLTLHFSLGVLRNVSKVGLPFFISAIFSTMYFKADTLLLGVYRSDTEVGMYNASMRVIDAQMFIPMTIMATLYPLLSKFHFHEASDFVKVFRRSFLTFSLLGIVITLTIYFGAAFIIDIVYSSPYREAVPTLEVLSFSVVFYFLNFLLSQTLVAVNRETSFTLVMVLSALLNIAVNLVLIPNYGIVGAAWSRVSTEMLMTAFFGVLLYYHFRHAPMKYVNSIPLQEFERV
jgi:O-antigen/teichoic acid export membrane protein